MSHSRRAFLASIAGTASLAAGVRAAAQAPGAGKWDLAWMDTLKGRHKQLYDLMWHTLRPNTLNPPTNYFEIHEELSGLKFPDVNVVIGANSSCMPINASDALWAKYTIGERYKITDPATGKPAVRNVYLGSATSPTGGTVRGLQARGAVFMMCNKALQGVSRDWARDLAVSPSDLHAELVAGMNPGVKVVPALTWAVGTLQERGFTYEKL